MMRVSACSVIILALAAVARADWSLAAADGPQQPHLTVNTWSALDGLSVTDQSGKLMKVDTRTVITLASDHKPAAASNAWRLTLRNGDTLLGQAAAISGQSLTFTLPELGTIDIPLKSILSLARAKSPPGPTNGAENAEKDIVHLNNGDTMEGLLAAVAPDKIQLATGAETGNAAATDIALTLVDRINFAGVTAPRTVPPLSVRMNFLSGTTLTVPFVPAPDAFAWSINDITFADPSGAKHKLSSDQILSIEVLGGRVVSLLDLDPAENQQSTFLGTHWPLGINQTPLGRPLTVAKNLYPRGLGVHTRSHLAYDLDGSFDALKLRVALDDSAAPRGEADVSILIDGKILWQKSAMNIAAAQISDELTLPIKGGKHLELRADPPKNHGNLDILGRVDWIAPVLLRQ